MPPVTYGFWERQGDFVAGRPPDYRIGADEEIVRMRGRVTRVTRPTPAVVLPDADVVLAGEGPDEA